MDFLFTKKGEGTESPSVLTHVSFLG